MPNGATASVSADRPVADSPVAAGSATGGAAGGPANWRVLAACRSAEPELFFPASGPELTIAHTERAKAVCGTCEVRRHCLQFALATRQPYGIWGGMSEHERRVMPS